MGEGVTKGQTGETNALSHGEPLLRVKRTQSLLQFAGGTGQPAAPKKWGQGSKTTGHRILKAWRGGSCGRATMEVEDQIEKTDMIYRRT